MRTTAFCPGHVSCVFQPHREEDPLRSGSRGIGFCLSRGAVAEVEDHDLLEITVNGSVDDANVTRRALLLMGVDDVMVRIRTDLPLSQGFAMSAAGTVAACLASASLREMGPDDAYRAAHIAELEEGGGMGDVAGIVAGGASVRTVPGLPPHGRAEPLDLHGELLVAVLGPPIRTGDVLSDEMVRGRIEQLGRECTDRFLNASGWDSLFRCSRRFATGTGLMGTEVENAIRALEPHGQASMCMLGNSLFFCGDVTAARGLLGDEAWTCSIDLEGPRLIDGLQDRQ